MSGVEGRRVILNQDLEFLVATLGARVEGKTLTIEGPNGAVHLMTDAYKGPLIVWEPPENIASGEKAHISLTGDYSFERVDLKTKRAVFSSKGGSIFFVGADGSLVFLSSGYLLPPEETVK